MLQANSTISLPQIYCGSCHLSTRSDVPRCLHCNKPLIEATPVRKRQVRPSKTRRHAG